MTAAPGHRLPAGFVAVGLLGSHDDTHVCTCCPHASYETAQSHTFAGTCSLLKIIIHLLFFPINHFSLLLSLHVPPAMTFPVIYRLLSAMSGMCFKLPPPHTHTVPSFPAIFYPTVTYSQFSNHYLQLMY